MKSHVWFLQRKVMSSKHFYVVCIVLELVSLLQLTKSEEHKNETASADEHRNETVSTDEHRNDTVVTDEHRKETASTDKHTNKTASEIFMEDDSLMSHAEFKHILFDNMIIPDCIDTVPEHQVKVTFYHGHKVKLGNMIPSKNITTHSPHLVTWPGTIKEYFTLVMVDLDEPQRLYPDERAWLHWLIVNIPGTSRYQGDLKARYIPPKPMEESGKHRYVFVVYKQPKKLKFDEVVLINETKHNDLKRGHFSCRDFSKEYRLGEPWAVNFFQAEFEL